MRLVSRTIILKVNEVRLIGGNQVIVWASEGRDTLSFVMDVSAGGIPVVASDLQAIVTFPTLEKED